MEVPDGTTQSPPHSYALLDQLTVIEELIVGTVHGKRPAAILSELADGSLMEAAATSLLMVLVLTPYFAMREINSELGNGVLRAGSGNLDIGRRWIFGLNVALFSG